MVLQPEIKKTTAYLYLSSQPGHTASEQAVTTLQKAHCPNNARYRYKRSNRTHHFTFWKTLIAYLTLLRSGFTSTRLMKTAFSIYNGYISLTILLFTNALAFSLA